MTELTTIAKLYHASVSSLRKIKSEYNLDDQGLEKIVEVKRDLLLKIPGVPKEFTYDTLARAYVDLGSDPDIFSEFIGQFDENQKALDEKLDTSRYPGSRSDRLLKAAVQFYNQHDDLSDIELEGYPK